MINKDTKEKLEDDFIEFWDTYAEKLGLGKYSSEIARFWFDKIDVAIAEERAKISMLYRNWKRRPEVDDTDFDDVISKLN